MKSEGVPVNPYLKNTESRNCQNCTLESKTFEQDFNVLRLYYEAVLEHCVYQNFWTSNQSFDNIPAYYDEMDHTTNYSRVWTMGIPRKLENW